jgi:hypothetical protein
VPIAGSVFLGIGLVIVISGMSSYAKSKDLAAPGSCGEPWSVVHAGASPWRSAALSRAVIGGALFAVIVLPIAVSTTRGPRPREPLPRAISAAAPGRSTNAGAGTTCSAGSGSSSA